tara:strand:+ start:437 stop:772 length:336 start_codon:yes stop_codon:yes gene_type:complete
MQIKTQDKIVQTVLRKMDERSLIGQKKYGATMMEEIEGQKKDLNRFLIDVQEELMDALLYIESAKRCLSDEIEDAMLQRISTDSVQSKEYFNIEVNEEKILQEKKRTSTIK